MTFFPPKVLALLVRRTWWSEQTSLKSSSPRVTLFSFMGVVVLWGRKHVAACNTRRWWTVVGCNHLSFHGVIYDDSILSYKRCDRKKIPHYTHEKSKVIEPRTLNLRLVHAYPTPYSCLHAWRQRHTTTQ